MFNLELLVQQMKQKSNIDMNKILDKIISCQSLTDICILGREYLSPQGTNMESIIKEHLNIGPKIDETSGDGCKNNINYELKVSIHSINSKFNFVQIRPDHNVHYYILIGYNMYDIFDQNKGKGYVFKVPSDTMYDLIIKYGGYAHGTKKVLGNTITLENLKGRNCEYALRCNPNAKKGKDYTLWNELLKYEVTYSKDNF
jgi:hypothetical protein